jgi:hypothetical protein
MLLASLAFSDLNAASNGPQRLSTLPFSLPSPSPPIGINMGAHKSFMRTFSCSQCHLELFHGAGARSDTISDKQTEKKNTIRYRTICISFKVLFTYICVVEHNGMRCLGAWHNGCSLNSMAPTRSQYLPIQSDKRPTIKDVLQQLQEISTRLGPGAILVSSTASVSQETSVSNAMVSITAATRCAFEPAYFLHQCFDNLAGVGL